MWRIFSLLQSTKAFLPSFTEKFTFLHLTSVIEFLYHNATIYRTQTKTNKQTKKRERVEILASVSKQPKTKSKRQKILNSSLFNFLSRNILSTSSLNRFTICYSVRIKIFHTLQKNRWNYSLNFYMNRFRKQVQREQLYNRKITNRIFPERILLF